MLGTSAFDPKRTIDDILIGKAVAESARTNSIGCKLRIRSILRDAGTAEPFPRCPEIQGKRFQSSVSLTQARLRELEHARSEADWVRLGEELTLDLIETQRRHIQQALRDGTISDESRRRVERDLDLLEARTRHDFRAESGGA